jgi:hypothetical protein
VATLTVAVFCKFYDKKSPTVQEVENCGASFSMFLGGFEEGYLRPACHSKPSMVVNIPNTSREIYVCSRKICIVISQKATVQKHIKT